MLVNNAGVYGELDGRRRLRPRRGPRGDRDQRLRALAADPGARCRCCVAATSPRIVNVSSGAGQLAEMGGGRRRLPALEGGAERAHPDARRRRAARSASTRSAPAGCAPTWAARARRARSRRAPTPRSGSRRCRTTARAAASSATASRFPGRNAAMAASTAEMIRTAVERLQREVPALAKLKLVFGLELRGRGDVQLYRVEVPGPKISKGFADDERVRVSVPALALQRARRRRQGRALARGIRPRPRQGRGRPEHPEAGRPGDRPHGGPRAAQAGALSAGRDVATDQRSDHRRGSAPPGAGAGAGEA